MALTVGTDTYLSLADADAYFSGRLLSTTWSDLSTTDKEAALRMACRYMDGLNWQGERAAQTQTLAWPRKGVLKWGDGDGEVDDESVPTEIKYIQCEIALWLVREQGSEETGQARAITVPGLSVAFSPGWQPSWPRYLKALLSPWLAARSSCILEMGRG
jgi:hypothetical protein